MSAKNFLVTGGSGFIGSALVRRLLAEGHSVRVIDNNSRGNARRLADVANDIEFIEADIRDRDAVIAAAHGIDTVCHLAYVNGTEFFYSKPELVLDVAIRGMLNIIDACRNNDCGDLVLASSSEVYQTPPIVPTAENAPLLIPDISNPRYSYGGGKILCELMAMNYGLSGFQRVTIFRPHNVYGVDMGWEHVVPHLSIKAANALEKLKGHGPVPLTIQGDGTQTRAFVHINDFTEGLSRVIKYGIHREIYHIGTEEELSIETVARNIVSVFGRMAEISCSESPVGGTPRRCPDISKMRSIGYQPSILFEDGIRDVTLWYQANRHLQLGV